MWRTNGFLLETNFLKTNSDVFHTLSTNSDVFHTLSCFAKNAMFQFLGVNAAVSCCFLILSSAAPLCATPFLRRTSLAWQHHETKGNVRMSQCLAMPSALVQELYLALHAESHRCESGMPKRMFFCKSLAKQQPDFRIGSLLPSRR